MGNGDAQALYRPDKWEFHNILLLRDDVATQYPCHVILPRTPLGDGGSPRLQTAFGQVRVVRTALIGVDLIGGDLRCRTLTASALEGCYRG